MFLSKKIKYLIVGTINTIFGYSISVVNYFLFYDNIGILFYSFLNQFLSISFSFLTHKFFVFENTGGKIISEYFKSWIVYGSIFAISTIILYFFLEILKLNIYLTQLLMIILFVPISYILNDKFTFKINNSKK